MSESLRLTEYAVENGRKMKKVTGIESVHVHLNELSNNSLVRKEKKLLDVFITMHLDAFNTAIII